MKNQKIKSEKQKQSKALWANAFILLIPIASVLSKTLNIFFSLIFLHHVLFDRKNNLLSSCAISLFKDWPILDENMFPIFRPHS